MTEEAAAQKLLPVWDKYPILEGFTAGDISLAMTLELFEEAGIELIRLNEHQRRAEHVLVSFSTARDSDSRPLHASNLLDRIVPIMNEFRESATEGLLDPNDPADRRRIDRMDEEEDRGHVSYPTSDPRVRFHTDDPGTTGFGPEVEIPEDLRRRVIETWTDSGDDGHENVASDFARSSTYPRDLIEIVRKEIEEERAAEVLDQYSELSDELDDALQLSQLEQDLEGGHVHPSQEAGVRREIEVLLDRMDARRGFPITHSDTSLGAAVALIHTLRSK